MCGYMDRDEMWRVLWGMKALGIFTWEEVMEIDRRMYGQ